MRRVRLIGVMVCCALCAVSLVAQRPVPGEPSEEKVPVTIRLQVGNVAYKVKGQGTCDHFVRASTDDVPAERWVVKHSDGSRGLTLDTSRPKKGSAATFSLAVGTGGTMHIVDTVKAPNASNTAGSGTVTVAPAAKGATFTIDATAANRTKITGTITCTAFNAPRVVSGH